eukprot:XP_014015679.1 PREDICTED: centromere-associated protein E isoform X10 [Salmo salar]
MKTKDKTLRTFSNSTFESSQKANVIHRVKGSYFLKLYTMLEESAVKVCVRVRPLIEREETAAESAEPVKLYWKTDKKTIHQVDDGNLTKNFSFDRVFSAEETTLQLYQELAKPLVVSTVEGYNGTIFAYGQTSSGKTFTMMGSSLTPGVIPLAMEDVFQTIKNCPKKEFLLRVSYLEIYNETVTDLLCDSWKRKPLEIREGNNKNVYVADLTEELVTSPEQALAWIRKGEKNRHYGKTKMNQRSSRSHTIFRMILENRDRGDSASGENPDSAIIVSHLNLVDLAGAERASQTGAEGTRFKEGCNINRSLFTLGQVIKKLSDETQKGFTNYRDSKLTRILQNSLGGNAKTVIICTITPVTLEETLSTLQFASAAKNMKNDPHVTEVSDDGALLRRYRNEIVDLKRRLHEVSSVTQTTATEKETLSQILQEKDQLQREQEDRIKNLTKLLVTSSNFVTIKKMPKRRVTWGGKLPSPAFHHAGESDLSFAEPFFKKRKADMSVLTEQNEDGDEFDSTFDMEMNQSNLTVRGFAESEFLSPNQLNKLSEKVSCLELQLENETQQKQEAMEEVETFQRRVAELEKQLEGKSLMPADAQLEKETQQNQEDMEEVETFQRRVAELEKQLEGKSLIPVDAQLEKETQQNQEDMEEVETFEIRVAELEKQLEKSQMPADAQEQMKRGFEETIQLCETLVSEKEMVATERDYLKQELNILMEQTENLKKEKAALLQEMEEKKEMDEFNSLEEESKREYEKELLNDISSLKKAMEASGRKSQELEANLVAMSEELKKKGDWAEELQRSSDVDLVQQVKQLRRSLDDAEGLSRDTKKEWAHLRSENISLKERAVTLTAGYERMEAQVNGLRHQLETEKSSFKKMQVDLQRELQGAFEENTKLTTLLDGKVPKNLIDSIELEKTVADLKKELDKSHEDERTLQAKIEDLSALQDLPDKVNSLMMQVCDLTEELCAVQKERDMLVSAKACSEEEAHQFRELAQSSQEQLVKLQDDLSKAELRENDLTQQCTDITEQLETLHKDLARSSVENSQLLTTVEESSLRLKENEQHRASIEDQLCGMQQVMKELEEKLAESESSKERYDNLSQEHQDQIRQLSEEVIQVQAELKRQQHLNSEQQSCAQQDDQHQLQIQELRAALEAMTEERSQLNSDLQQNMEMAAESQGLLHSIQEELRQQRQVNSDLESQSLQKETLLEQQMRQLSDALESGEAERERLLFEKTDSPQNHAEELEKLLSTVTSLTGERDQLQEILEGIREERNQLKRDLEDNVEMSIKVQEELKQQQHLNSEQQTEREHQEAQLQQQLQQLGEELETMTQERCQLKGDLQENLEMAAETQGLLRSIQEELRQQRQVNSDLESQSLQKESLLEQQAKQLNEELESVRAERERLLSEKADGSQNHAEELEKLLSTVTSLTEERDQLQEILEGIREERNHLKRNLEDNVEMMQQLEKEGIHMRDERAQIQRDLQENMEMRTLEQQHLNSQQQAESEQQIKQLEEECKGFKEGQFHLKGEADTSHKMLSDANATISILTEQINNLEQSTSCCSTRAGEGLCSRLEASMQKLQVSLVRLQLVIDGASKPGHGPLVGVTQVEEVMILKLLPLLPKPTKKIYSNINRSTVQITNAVWDTKVLLKLCAKDYKTHVEALVQNDLAVFEERRLQDLLLCRAQAPSHSVKVVENDLLGVWDERLSELLDRREGYLQKMNSVLKKLEESLATHPAAVSEELRVRERSNEELNALCMVHSPDSAAVENFLVRELARRSVLAQANTLALQGLRDERCGLLKELGVVRAQADSQLKEERSKTSTLLQILERAPVKTEADLLRDNQQLALQRQQLDGEIKEMQMRVEQLEEDQIKAADSVSNHKQATQLLQTELQDACAQVKDREGSIEILKEKLRETEVLAKRRASPSALELEELKAKLLKMELEMTASSSKHQEELLRMTTVLNHKEDALRTLKETLRRSQQEGEQSFNEGPDLHARLITARGRMVQSNILLEKNKLEEELKRLQSKISELESLVSTQQGEITKWKARAIKLKENKRDVVDKPLSPSTPTKHRLPMNSEQFLNSPKRFLNSPKRFLNSPKRFLNSPKRLIDSPKKFLDSPKSKFFDVRPGSESMSINCPKQFFDNSNLGTIQEVAGIPISEIEAAGSAEEGNWCNLCVWDKSVIASWSTNTSSGC